MIRKQSGQALVTLLFFVVMGIMVTAAAVILLYNNIVAASTMEQGYIVYAAAESGIENAMLRLLRDKTYIGENLTISDATVTISVNGTVITAKAVANNVMRTIQAQTVYNNKLSVSSWKEIP